MSYSDAKFVSEGYARELTTAQTQAVDVETDRRRSAGADSGLARDVGDEKVRALDQQLLLDLLKIETRADAWSGCSTPRSATSTTSCWSAT